MRIVTQEDIDGREPDSWHYRFDYIRNALLTANAVEYRHMVDRQVLYPTRHCSDGISRVGTAEEQVSLAQILYRLPQRSQGNR